MAGTVGSGWHCVHYTALCYSTNSCIRVWTLGLKVCLKTSLYDVPLTIRQKHFAPFFLKWWHSKAGWHCGCRGEAIRDNCVTVGIMTHVFTRLRTEATCGDARGCKHENWKPRAVLRAESAAESCRNVRTPLSKRCGGRKVQMPSDLPTAFCFLKSTPAPLFPSLWLTASSTQKDRSSWKET